MVFTLLDANDLFSGLWSGISNVFVRRVSKRAFSKPGTDVSGGGIV